MRRASKNNLALLLLLSFWILSIPDSFVQISPARAQENTMEYDFENKNIGDVIVDPSNNDSNNIWYFGQVDTSAQRAIVVEDPGNPGNKCLEYFTTTSNANALSELVCKAITDKTGTVALEFKFKVMDPISFAIPIISFKDGSSITCNAANQSNLFPGNGSGLKIPYVYNEWTTYKFVINTAAKNYTLYMNNETVPVLKNVTFNSSDPTLRDFRIQIGKAQPNLPIYLDDIRTYIDGDTSVVQPAIPSLSDVEVYPGASINLSTATSGGTIYYTTDGSTPTTDSSIFTPGTMPPIIISTEGSVIRTLVVKNGVSSVVASYGPYTFRKPEIMDFESDPIGTSYGSMDKGWVFDNTNVGSAVVVKDPVNPNEQCLKVLTSLTNNLRRYLERPLKNGDYVLEYRTMVDQFIVGTSGTTRQALTISGRDTNAGAVMSDFIAPSFVGVVAGATSGNFTIGSKSTTYYPNVWKRFKFVFHIGATSTYDVYVDGSSTALVSGVALPANLKEISRFGVFINNNMSGIPVYIDDIRLYYQAYPLPGVSADVTAGQVEAGTQISLAPDTVDASVYYTLDGSKPTVFDTLYTGPILLDHYSATIKAIAVKNGVKGDVQTFGPYTLRTINGMTCTSNIFKVGSTLLKRFNEIKIGDKVTNEVTVYNDTGTNKGFVVVLGMYNGNSLRSLNFKKFTTSGPYTTVTIDLDIQGVDLTGNRLVSYLWNDIDDIHAAARHKELK